ncbi:MAG: hypothetical protein AAGA54_09735 [Myxococcota bacterium]
MQSPAEQLRKFVVLSRLERRYKSLFVLLERRRNPLVAEKDLLRFSEGQSVHRPKKSDPLDGAKTSRSRVFASLLRRHAALSKLNELWKVIRAHADVVIQLIGVTP